MSEATEEASAEIPAELLATEEASAAEPAAKTVVTEAEAKLASLNASARSNQKSVKPATLRSVMDELAAIREMLESLTS